MDCRGGEFKSSPTPFQGFFFLSNSSYGLNRQQAYHERGKSSRKNTENFLLTCRCISLGVHPLQRLFVESFQPITNRPKRTWWRCRFHASSCSQPAPMDVFATCTKGDVASGYQGLVYSCVKLQSQRWWLGGSANVCTAVLRSSCAGGRTRG